MGINSEHSSTPWHHIATELAEDLSLTTDEELLLELESDGIDISVEAERVRELITNVVAERGKQQLARARSEMDDFKARSSQSEMQINSEQRQKLIEFIHASDSGLSDKLTLAARKGDELTDEDLDEIIRALFDLGRIDEHGNLL